MRGTWRGSGTFETGGGGGFVLLAAFAVMAAATILAWLAARLLWILGGGLAAVAVAVVVGRHLIRRQQQREAVHAREHPFVRELAAATPGVVEYHQHIYIHGLTDDQQAAIIRAIPAQPGGAITEED